MQVNEKARRAALTRRSIAATEIRIILYGSKTGNFVKLPIRGHHRRICGGTVSNRVCFARPSRACTMRINSTVRRPSKLRTKRGRGEETPRPWHCLCNVHIFQDTIAVRVKDMGESGCQHINIYIFLCRFFQRYGSFM